MKSRFIKFGFVVLIALSAASCSRKVVGEGMEKLERRKTNELVATLDSLSTLKPRFFYSKISTKYRDTTQRVSFKTSIRMVKDSAINALITFAAIPIYNSMLTPDTLTLLNKRNKCYTKAQLSFLKENFGVAFDYRNVEELILGLPLAYDTNQKYFQIHNPFNYIISSHRKREIRRSDRRDLDEIIIKYFLSNDAKALKRMEIESPGDSTRIQVDYLSREMVSNYNVPKDVQINIRTPRNEIIIEMSYDKIEIDEPQSLFMIIPEGYEICE